MTQKSFNSDRSTWGVKKELKEMQTALSNSVANRFPALWPQHDASKEAVEDIMYQTRKGAYG